MKLLSPDHTFFMSTVFVDSKISFFLNIFYYISSSSNLPQETQYHFYLCSLSLQKER